MRRRDALIGFAYVQMSGTTDRHRGASNLEIIRNDSHLSTKRLADYFTGSVRIDSLSKGDSARAYGALVTSQPGARSAWQTDPLGQTLIVTSGKDWTSCTGGAVVEIDVGDIISFAPGLRQWRGPTITAMNHLAVQEATVGKLVEWMEQISDEDYLARCPRMS